MTEWGYSSVETDERLAFGMQRCSKGLRGSQCRSSNTQAGHTCCRQTHAPLATAMQSALPARPTFSAMHPDTYNIDRL